MTILEKPEILKKLGELSLFKAFANEPKTLEQIYGVLQRKNARSGETIIEEGQSGQEMYILLTGEIEIFKHTMEREPYTVAKLKDSMRVFFGELALVDDDRRSASVVALTDCELLVLSRDNFTELGKLDTRLGWTVLREIAGILSKRLRKANEDALVLFETLVHELSH